VVSPDISVLAKREAEAEARKGKADMAWRKAWWATTIALGQVKGRTEIGAAQKIVRAATGQAVGYVSDRTRTGRKFVHLEMNETLPPRMALAVVQAGVEVTDEVVEELRAAEQNGVSLREFTASLTGKGWAGTAEGTSPEAIEKIAVAQPEVFAKVVGEQMASSPDFAKGVTEAMGTAAKGLPAHERDQLTTSVVGASVGVTEADKADLSKTVTRTAKAHEARESEAPSGIRALKVLPVMWDVDALLEQFEAAPRDDESVAVMKLFSQWAESMARRAKMIADGDFLPPSDDEFAAGIEAILNSGGA
jgi:hypothetical protein